MYCGGNNEGIGGNLSTSPSISTFYFVRAEGVCNTTSCISKLIIVISVPAQPDTIVGSALPTVGGNELYTVTNIPGTSYSWTAPTGWTGTGTLNSITFIIGNNSGFISVIPSNVCGSGESRTLNVIVRYSISGLITYFNTSNTPMDSVWVFLIHNGNMIDSTQADTDGYYIFNRVANGLYNIESTTHKMWSGVNATDAVKVKRHFAGAELFTTSIQLHAADVNFTFKSILQML